MNLKKVNKSMIKDFNIKLSQKDNLINILKYNLEKSMKNVK